MIVSVQPIPDRLRGKFSNFNQQFFESHRSQERVHHQHTAVADHKPGVARRQSSRFSYCRVNSFGDLHKLKVVFRFVERFGARFRLLNAGRSGNESGVGLHGGNHQRARHECHNRCSGHPASSKSCCLLLRGHLARDVVACNHVAVSLVQPLIEIRQEDSDLLKQLRDHVAGHPCRMNEPLIRNRADEKALVVCRKLTDILYECGKRSTLKQILLYIRVIKRTDYETSTSKIITYRPKDLLPSEVTHHRDDHVSSMHIADVVVVFLACEKVSQLAVLVRLKDQLLKGGEPAAATHAFYPVCDVQTFEPETSVDILEAGLIRAREINLKIVLNNSADPREVSSVCVIVRRKLVDQPDYIGDGCAGRRDFASGYWPAQQQGQILR